MHKVRAHVSLESAADDHEEWCIRGNRLADLWAKKGAKLWAVPPQQVLFIEGVETLALAASRWHARAQQMFGALELSDSQGVAGTSDLVVDLNSTPEGRMLLAECAAEGVEPYADGPFVPSTSTSSASCTLAAAAAPPPPQEPWAAFALKESRGQ